MESAFTYCGFTLGIISLSVLILENTTVYDMHGEPRSKWVVLVAEWLPQMGFGSIQAHKEVLSFWGSYSALVETNLWFMSRTSGMPAVLISALLVMSDFESTFLKEYSWLQRSYHILIVKSVMTLWGLNTKQAMHTLHRSQTPALFRIETEKQDTPQ